ncbi:MULTISPECIES: hypothetical protein [unclassified Xanthomonas]|uniref:hypothetical protein n=1 Tax=unclassified Xanthomonas TaxID=2643310 RepID=UPI002B239A06|nr:MULTISPECIES: hypothetical protein [unclassified Xanthomonas]MEA9563773.1 hypothetical protein [Xanthomonas sp. WHRI 8932A]MEA9634899.1 hypothetical protein [Xanthomonas sp. WHRI 8812E]
MRPLHAPSIADVRTRRTQRGAWNSLGSDFVAIAFQQGEIAATTVAVVPWFEDAGVADLQRMAIVQIEHQTGVRPDAAATLGRICRHKLMSVFPVGITVNTQAHRLPAFARSRPVENGRAGRAW